MMERCDEEEREYSMRHHGDIVDTNGHVVTMTTSANESTKMISSANHSLEVRPAAGSIRTRPLTFHVRNTHL